MITTTGQRLPLLAGATLVAAMLGALALSAGVSIEAQWVLIGWLGLGAATAYVLFVLKGDLLLAVFAWFVTLIVLHEEFWRQPVPLFFSLTVPRIGLVVLIALLAGMVAVGRMRLRHAWPVSGLILSLVVYFALSAAVSGFETRSEVSVHYRLIGGYVFPFVVFYLILHAFHCDHDFKRLAIFFAALSVYLTVTGWAEQWGVAALIWPEFINDPNVGIHWGRVRGPFVMSAAMGLALTYCFFNNLVLARNIIRARWFLYALNAAMVPVIFWTKTRSVWLSFVVCGLVWAAYSRRRISRVVSVCVFSAATLMVVLLNMDNFMSGDRERGGMTDTEPLLLRIGLAQMSAEIVKEYPLFGIGFGHFRDFAPSYARDPASPFYAFGTTALEHNNLLSIAAETGLVGLGLYLVMVVVLLRYSVRLYRKLPPGGPGFVSRDLLVLYWILTAAYFVDGTFRETSDNPFANSLFFGLSAVPVALDILLSPKPLRAIAGFGRSPNGKPIRRGAGAGRPDGKPIRSGPGAGQPNGKPQVR